MDEGKLFLGALFMMISLFILLFIDSYQVKFFGGGVLALLGLFSLLGAFKEERK